MKRIIGIILLLLALTNVVSAEEEWASSVQQTADGGYILVGISEGDATKSHDEASWLMKTDSNGNKQWNTILEGSFELGEWNKLYSVQQTSDGGYILAGEKGRRHDGSQFWLVKTDSKGNKQWDKTFGRSYSETAYSVRQTTDDGYIIAGGTFSLNTDVWNIWLVKTDSNGNKQWDKIFDGENNNGWDKAYSVQQTTDGGYILAGYTCTGPRDSGDFDAWLIKTDSNGNKQWDKTFKGDGRDQASSVQQTTDGGYIFAGWTGPYRSSDFWLVKTDSKGNKQWDKTFGGDGNDLAKSVQQTTDGGYIIAGWMGPYGGGWECLAREDRFKWK